MWFGDLKSELSRSFLVIHKLLTAYSVSYSLSKRSFFVVYPQDYDYFPTAYVPCGCVILYSYSLLVSRET